MKRRGLAIGTAACCACALLGYAVGCTRTCVQLTGIADERDRQIAEARVAQEEARGLREENAYLRSKRDQSLTDAAGWRQLTYNWRRSAQEACQATSTQRMQWCDDIMLAAVAEIGAAQRADYERARATVAPTSPSLR